MSNLLAKISYSQKMFAFDVIAQCEIECEIMHICLHFHHMGFNDNLFFEVN